MEEKKTHELTDEALDAVTGGAYCRYNEATGQYDVFKRSGEYVTSCRTETEALGMAASYTNAESPKFNLYDPSSAYNRGL